MAKNDTSTATTTTDRKATTPTLTVAQRKAVGALGSKSAKIRYLNEQRYTTGDIGRILGIKYQFAYNVLHQKVKDGTK